jgi:steroid 5-alpha reductase family enzyme
MPVHVLDDYYLAITGLITIAYQLIAFSIAFTLKFDKLTDFAGGTNFILLAVLTLAFSSDNHDVNARQIVASLFIMLWAARLSGFLLFRILKTGKDDRFDDKRDKFFPFLGFFVFQMVWVWTVSLPVTILNSPKVTQYRQPSFGTGCDIAGVIIFAIGFLMEAIADIQKYRFRMNPANKGKTCDKGFFYFTRHPNYAGEMLVQFAIYTLCLSPSANGYIPSGTGPYAAQYASIVGPFFLTFLLMFVSGLTLQERPGAKKKYEKSGPDGQEWLDYKRYTEQTSILVPFPPQLYRPLPTFLKRTLFLEFPFYVFDPAKHADTKKVQDQQAEEGRGRGSEATQVEDQHNNTSGSKDDLVNRQGTR